MEIREADEKDLIGLLELKFYEQAGYIKMIKRRLFNGLISSNPGTYPDLMTT